MLRVERELSLLVRNSAQEERAITWCNGTVTRHAVALILSQNSEHLP